jgi:hypothetical protein
MKRYNQLLLAIFAVAGVFGCKGNPASGDAGANDGMLSARCQAWCERKKTAHCTDPAPPTDCATTCNSWVTKVRAADCTQYYAAALACAEAHDACKDVDDCIKQNDALSVCIECLHADASCFN